MDKLYLLKQIDSVLPQTQCTRCTYPSCQEYAQAIVDGEANINQCPPGGDEVIAKLAKITNKNPIPLNPANGVIKPRQIAYIVEDDCIGCTLCIKACPVDAIIGANKMMHTVIANECSGCDLCVPACPVDCIQMIDDLEEWTKLRRDRARERFDDRKARKEQERQARELRLREQTLLFKKVATESSNPDKNTLSKTDLIEEIMNKAKRDINN